MNFTEDPEGDDRDGEMVGCRILDLKTLKSICYLICVMWFYMNTKCSGCKVGAILVISIN